ncbi:MAG TPA: fumarylacetoacetate hydrolase family protein [Geodermatophilus sp.]|nr:fumarylacetoacetate hydrolase family protein [Geodermatophilus sp.]
MRFLRVGEPGAERPAVEEGGRVFDISAVTPDLDGSFLAAGGIRRVREALAAGELPSTDVADLRLGPPIARPAAVLCIGQNYAAHAAESGSPPPEFPIIFFKHPNTVVGPFDDICRPPGAQKLDWEVELGVVIGRRARYLASPEEAADVIAGYTVSHDVSERAFQTEVSGGQWSKGKCCETFNPLGPYLVPADEVDPQRLGLRSWVNREPRQDSSTADMIFSVHHLVWDLSQYLVLEPGDLINTGTPQGVALSGRFPYLTDGDVVDLEIDGLGAQRQTVVPAEVPAPSTAGAS